MAYKRNRIIVHRIWSSSDLQTLMVETGQGTAAMFFIGLFTCADDMGILKWDKRKLGMEVLSVLYMKYKDDIDSWIKMMEELEMIVRYEENGHTFMFFPSWQESQNIKNPNYTEHPLPPEELLVMYPGYVRMLNKTIDKIISLIPNKTSTNPKGTKSIPKRLMETKRYIESIYELGYAVAGANSEIELSDSEKDKQEKRREEKKRKEKLKELVLRKRFDEFWKLYPRRDKKIDARKAFNKLNPDDDLLKVIIKDVEKKKKSSQWLSSMKNDGGKYIMLPASYLRAEAWTDEGVQKVAKKGESWND